MQINTVYVFCNAKELNKFWLFHHINYLIIIFAYCMPLFFIIITCILVYGFYCLQGTHTITLYNGALHGLEMIQSIFWPYILNDQCMSVKLSSSRFCMVLWSRVFIIRLNRDFCNVSKIYVSSVADSSEMLITRACKNGYNEMSQNCS